MEHTPSIFYPVIKQDYNLYMNTFNIPYNGPVSMLQERLMLDMNDCRQQVLQQENYYR